MKIKRISRRFLPYLLIIMAAIIMLWPQIHGHAFVSGYDYYFHMSRTYETAMQIKTGHFSYFLSLFSWNHSARIVNALYGPVGGYVSGLILLLTGSWLRWEISMSLLALILAGGTMYKLGWYWHVNPVVNLSLSILYMLSAPVSDYVFNQMFAGFGAALLPLLALLMSEILTQKDVQPIKFALILTLIVEVHLMTFILAMILVIPGLLVAFYSAHQSRSRLFKHLCKGTGLMLILSFNVWGGILEVFDSNFYHIIPTFPGTNLGNKSYSAILNTYPRTALSQTPSLIGIGVAFLIIVTVGLWIINWRHFNSAINLLMSLGVISVWLSSGYFPWRFVKRHFDFLVTLIQFPKRFLPLGLILIYLGFGIMLSRYLRQHNGKRMISTIGLIFLLCLIGWGWYRNYETAQQYINVYSSRQVINWHCFVNMKWQRKCPPNQLRNELRNDQPGQFLDQVDSPVPDYLPTYVTYRRPVQYKRLNPQASYQRTYISKPDYKWKPLNHGREFITLSSKHRQTRTVPFAKYAHTQVMLNGRRIEPKINRVGAVQLRLRPGQNRLQIQYHPSLGFRTGMLISIVTWLWLISAFSYRKFRGIS